MLHMVGCDHRICPLSMREKLSVQRTDLPGFLSDFQQAFPGTEVVVVSTCHRSEFYFAERNECVPLQPFRVFQWITERKGLRAPDYANKIRALRASEAVRHLFRVTAGLESQILGETQVVFQVKQAYQDAHRCQSTGRITHRAFQSAFRTSKRIARETSLRSPNGGLADYACLLAENACGHLQDRNVLILGAGRFASDILPLLTKKSQGKIMICNRTPARAQLLGARAGVTPTPWDQLPNALANADVVFSATSSRSTVLPASLIRAVQSDQGFRPRWLFDLAVPRDVDQEVSSIPGISLYTIDDLTPDQPPRSYWERQAQGDAARIIDEETARYSTWIRERTMA
jgi:glutamyl-tRNA reductase